MTQHTRTGPPLVGLLAAFLLGPGCTSPVPVEDPMAELARPGSSPRRHLGAMVELDATAPADEAYLKSLREIMWRPGYPVSTREAAFDRLAAYDPEGLKTTIRQQLPRLGARAWQERLCVLIAERGWVELSPAIVSAWARPIGFVRDLDRVEYKTLAALYGEEHVIDAVFDLLVESSKPYQQGLRGRCWELLVRLGQRQRLVELLEDRAVGPDDAMLDDLRAGAVELGVVPRTREEIIWVRKLREPEHADFWSQAASVVHDLPDTRRAELELRDLPILVAASIHDAELLHAGKDELYDALARRLAGRRKHIDSHRFEGYPGEYAQTLNEHRKDLTWGDLAAMHLALRAVEVPQVVEHLFDYAERDRLDESCEYGGVINLDGRGRFEILEFPPRFRRHDNEFIASQEMMDAGYTAVFHFHNHAQTYRNGRHAAPGIGDLNYADNTRANCLVLTFVSEERLAMDFYRHGRVIVDLGEVPRAP